MGWVPVVGWATRDRPTGVLDHLLAEDRGSQEQARRGREMAESCSLPAVSCVPYSSGEGRVVGSAHILGCSWIPRRAAGDAASCAAAIRRTSSRSPERASVKLVRRLWARCSIQGTSSAAPAGCRCRRGLGASAPLSCHCEAVTARGLALVKDGVYPFDQCLRACHLGRVRVAPRETVTRRSTVPRLR